MLLLIKVQLCYKKKKTPANANAPPIFFFRKPWARVLEKKIKLKLNSRDDFEIVSLRDEFNYCIFYLFYLFF